MPGKKTSTAVIGHIGVYNVHFRNDQQCSAQTAQNDNTNLVFLKIIVCSAIVKGIVLDRLTSGKVIHTILNSHLAVFAVIQTSSLDIVLRAVHEPQGTKQP